MQKRRLQQLLLKLKSYSRKGNILVYLNPIAYSCAVFNRKGRAMLIFVYISLEAEELFLIHLTNMFYNVFNENSTKKFMCKIDLLITTELRFNVL